MLYISGQIPLNPSSQILISEDINAQIKQVFENIRALCLAAGGNLSDVVKLAVYLMDLTDSHLVNSMMLDFFAQPFPARTMIQVAGLPRGAKIEVDAMMVIR